VIRGIFCTAAGCVRGEIVVPEPGCFWWYRYKAAAYLQHLAEAIYCAPPAELEKLRRVYPQMVAAFEHGNKYEPPPRFEPRYDAPAPEGK